MSTFSLILPDRDPTSSLPFAANEVMPSTLSDLTGLRRRLDEIDDRLQDLLIDRAEIVSMVADSKKEGNQPSFQPAREAEIIRRLVRRHHGAFPVGTLVRMWREMLAATVAMQSPFSVAVFAPSDRQGFWDLARDHYGSNTPMTAYDAVGPVLRAVAGGESSVGVLPLPQPEEPEPWWPHLLSMAENTLHVLARLPFGAIGNARNNASGALVIGHSIQRESGLDRTLLAATCAAEITRAQILKLLSAAGLVCTFFASCQGGMTVNLIEIEGFVPVSDRRLDTLQTELGGALYRLLPLGGYAVPLPLMAPAAKRLA
jgi:chorismate mutase/prephenate dehydratase